MPVINHVLKDVIHEHLKCGWGIAEAKVMTVDSNNLRGVLKAALYSSPFLKCMFLYPHYMSNLVNISGAM